MIRGHARAESDARIAAALHDLVSSLEVLESIHETYGPLAADDPNIVLHPEHQRLLLTTILPLIGAVRALVELHWFLFEPPEPAQSS